MAGKVNKQWRDKNAIHDIDLNFRRVVINVK